MNQIINYQDIINLSEDNYNEWLKTINPIKDISPIIKLQVHDTEQTVSGFGVGIHDNIVTASIEAIIASINRLIIRGALTPEQVVSASV